VTHLREKNVRNISVPPHPHMTHLREKNLRNISVILVTVDTGPLSMRVVKPAGTSNSHLQAWKRAKTSYVLH
jgi:hypothetical protein